MKTFYRSLVLFLCILASSCTEENTSATLKSHAIPNDENVNIVRFTDGGTKRYVLVSKNKGYELVCANPIKRKALIEATGFPFEFLSDTPLYSMDSDEFLRLQIDQQPKIECSTMDKKLFKVDMEGANKYFFSDSKFNGRLFMFGCQALVDAMGFDAKSAEVLESRLIEDLKLLKADDSDDINCLDGVSVGGKVNWEKGENKVVIAKASQVLDMAVYTAKLPSREYAKIVVKSRDGYCDWLSVQNVSDSIVISGQVPADFTNQSCKVTLVAAADSIFEDSKTYTVTTDLKKPILTTDCLKKTLVMNAIDFKGCSVKNDVGTIQAQFSNDEPCVDALSYDPATGGLKLNKLPGLGSVCQVTFNAQYNGVAAEPVTIAVERLDGCFSQADNRIVGVDTVRETSTLVYQESKPKGFCSSKPRFITCQKGGAWSAPTNPAGFGQESCENGCYSSKVGFAGWYASGERFTYSEPETVNIGENVEHSYPLKCNEERKSRCLDHLKDYGCNGGVLENVSYSCTQVLVPQTKCRAVCSRWSTINLSRVQACNNGTWR